MTALKTNVILPGDSIELMNSLPEKSVDMILPILPTICSWAVICSVLTAPLLTV